MAAKVGLGSDAAAARTAMEAVAMAQAQQTAVLVGDAGGGAPSGDDAAGGGGVPGGSAEANPPPPARKTAYAPPVPSGGRGRGAPAPPPEDEMVVLRDFGVMVRDSRNRRGETTYRVGFLDDDGRDLGLDQDQWLPAAELRDGHPQGAQAIATFEDNRTRRADTARGEPSAKEKEALRAAGRSEPPPPRRDLRRMRREERQDAEKEESAGGENLSRGGRKRRVPQRVSREEVEEEEEVEEPPVKKKRGPGRPRKNPVPTPKKKRGPGRPRKQPPVAEEPSEDAAELFDTQPESEDLPRGGGAGTSGEATDDPWNMIQDMAVMTQRNNQEPSPEAKRGRGRKPKAAGPSGATGLGAGLVVDMYRGKLWESAQIVRVVDLEDMMLEIKWGEAAPKHISAEALARREQCLPKLCKFYEQVIKAALLD